MIIASFVKQRNGLNAKSETRNLILGFVPAASLLVMLIWLAWANKTVKTGKRTKDSVKKSVKRFGSFLLSWCLGGWLAWDVEKEEGKDREI